MTNKSLVLWSTQEVQTFLGIIGDAQIQRELDGSVRNEKVFQSVSQRMASLGYQRTSDQCRIKCKKLRAEYRKIKDYNGRSGNNRKTWKWFDMMDVIYGHRPASMGREGGIDSATSLLEAMMEDSEGKRKRGQQDLAAVLQEMQRADERLLEERRERQFQILLEDAREARRQQDELAHQHQRETAAFNQGFLSTLSQLVQVLGSRHVPPSTFQ
ncbi:Zinc finger and SCAN domain-containing protein 29 [Merluccius polli]|uniref:Zinc finger and SCAN domain-containing protein 29 n=1 Tax=Merluccius polli TaxID=89951 RepID=A0AA47MZE4_MERPO|nr:Zinc finger and SCAN domain-containing protein 29 [Merluccius polli]